jgi:hypothetical protein
MIPAGGSLRGPPYDGTAQPSSSTQGTESQVQ